MKKLLLSILLLAIMSGCNKSPAELPVLRVAHAPHDHHSPLYVSALNPGYFNNLGGPYLNEITPKKEYELISGEKPVARVLIESSTGGKEIIRKLVEGHYDAAFGGVPAIVHFIDKKAPIKILAPVMAEGAGFVVNTALPIENWQGFVEHVRQSDVPFRVGFKIDVSVQNLIFETALKEEGLTYGRDIKQTDVDVQLINLHGAKNLIPALKNGLVDGFVIMQPFPAKSEHLGVGKTVVMLQNLPPTGKWAGNPCCAFAGRNESVLTKRQAMKDFSILMMRANEYIQANPEKSADYIAAWLGLPTEVELKSIPTIKFTNDFDARWNEGVDFWLQSMLELGLLNGTLMEAYNQGSHESLINDMRFYEEARSALKR